MDMELSTSYATESVEINKDYILYNDGKVYSKISNRFLKWGISRGYPCIRLQIDGRQRFYLVHILVAKYFIPNPNNLPEVNHKDGNKLNPCYTNLEWCTRSDNVKHAYNTGLTKSPNARETLQILNGNIVARFVSTRQASINTKINQAHIIEACNKQRKSAGGYEWRYA